LSSSPPPTPGSIANDTGEIDLVRIARPELIEPRLEIDLVTAVVSIEVSIAVVVQGDKSNPSISNC
jgi:hypothetical protein